MSQSVSQSVSLLHIQWVSQSVSESVTQSVRLLHTQWVSQSVSQWVSQSAVSQSSQWVSQSVIIAQQGGTATATCPPGEQLYRLSTSAYTTSVTFTCTNTTWTGPDSSTYLDIKCEFGYSNALTNVCCRKFLIPWWQKFYNESLISLWKWSSKNVDRTKNLWIDVLQFPRFISASNGIVQFVHTFVRYPPINTRNL